MAALLIEGRRVLLTGDGLVTRNPLTGRQGTQVMPRALNRDSRKALRSLAKLEDLPADTILPGHGEPWTGGAAKAVQLGTRPWWNFAHNFFCRQRWRAARSKTTSIGASGSALIPE
jgi:glyoxylase-like metal-dependent hydrolase (beta-lactamase superfamily II)